MNILKGRSKVSYNVNKYLLAKVTSIPLYLQVSKTLKVSYIRRIYVPKYKRYRFKTYSHLVHFDINDKDNNKELKVGDNIKVYFCRKLSAQKAMITQGWQ